MGLRLPIVAIVGRPNVGKSTLFNRIVGKRLSIVHEQEGVTRDRVAVETDWAGHDFYLVDTGGYIHQSEDIIDNEVRKQALLAVDEADVIMLMVDTVVGITREDEEIVKHAKRSKKPLVLVANKADNDTLENQSHIFYQLGLGEVFPISALNGRSVGDALDKVVSTFGEIQIEEELDEDAIRFAIVGMPNAGKSSLTNALLGVDRQIVTDVPGTTRDSINTSFKYFGQTYEMIDTAGLRRKAKVNDSIEYFSSIRTQQAIKSSDVVIVLIDAEKGFVSHDARVMEEIIKAGKGLIIGVNKWDLIEKSTNTMRDFKQQLIDDMYELRHYPIQFISTLERKRIFKLVDLVKEIHEEQQKRIQTRQLNLFLIDLVARLQPPSPHGKEVKLNYCSQVAVKPPVIVIFTNHPELIKTSYKRYLENHFREKFGFIGVPIRIAFRQK
ncbi:MAG: ribosome biogenesis GTPase Der [Candidatus Marinimicrobia bacterium]|nr:ribosome biogenesis GTPase Der [Candidatus Neomarinimicrobiota bacterium]MCF7850175.1 ribosome biogenesis GTPase Der [Candidatus Neomarinimicrobiota bacterium]MCF7905201.1 ribosome biogenesis GTPase Der [Candidatus Neomarinimicrobiota bacterium]